MTQLDKEIQEALFDPSKNPTYVAWNLKEQKAVGWLGTAKSKMEMENRLQKYKAPNHIKARQLYDPKRKVRRAAKAAWKARAHKLKTAAQKGRQVYDPAPSRWFKAMYRGIQKGSDVRNPAAIVKAIWQKLTPGKKAQIRKREASGEQFKYDLPLPDDYPTRGTGTMRIVAPFDLGEVQANVSAKDYLRLLASGIFQKMKRNDGSIALVKRCKSPQGNCNIFIDKVR